MHAVPPSQSISRGVPSRWDEWIEGQLAALHLLLYWQLELGRPRRTSGLDGTDEASIRVLSGKSDWYRLSGAYNEHHYPEGERVPN